MLPYSCPTDIYMHHFTDIRYTDITVTYTHRTSVHACIASIFLSSRYILYILVFHVIPVCMLYDYFLLLIWIFLLLDMRAVDMRYVEFHIYCSRFSLYCSTLSTELWSSYHVTRIMYNSCSCHIVYLTYQIIMIIWVWGRLDG